MATKKNYSSKSENKSDNPKEKKFDYELNIPIEEEKFSFIEYNDIRIGKSDKLCAKGLLPENNKKIAYNEMVRCIRLQIRPEDQETRKKIKFNDAHEKAKEFVNNYITINSKSED